MKTLPDIGFWGLPWKMQDRVMIFPAWSMKHCFSSNILLTHKEKKPVNRKSRNLFPWNAALFPDP
jgi:hypothetical protein